MLFIYSHSIDFVVPTLSVTEAGTRPVLRERKEAGERWKGGHS